MEKNKKAPSRHKAEDDYLLTTKLYCGYCGAFMCGECGTSRSGATHHYYKCMSIKKRKRTCHKKTVKKQWIEDLVVHETMEMLTSDDRIEAIVSQIMEMQDRENTTLPNLEKQLKEVQAGIENMLDFFLHGMRARTPAALCAVRGARPQAGVSEANRRIAAAPGPET